MKNLPKHVAIIMDGNRRWARSKGLSPLKGHQVGEERIEPIIDQAIKLGIPYLTFWAFSTENWKRTKREVAFLMRMYRHDLSKRIDRFHQKKVRINVIGNLAMFPKDIQRKTGEWMEKTKNNKKITVNLALSYGGRDEIIRAIKRIHDPQSTIQDLTKEKFEQYLDTVGQPDPELMIRTGGNHRLSGFLLWQMEYAELYFTDTLWPDFTPLEFEKALVWYQEQKRNFGK